MGEREALAGEEGWRLFCLLGLFSAYGSPPYSLKWKDGYGSLSHGCFKCLNRQALTLPGLCSPLGSGPPSEPLFIRLCPVLTELY